MLPPGRPKEGDVPPGGTARSARENRRYNPSRCQIVEVSEA